MLKNQHGYTLIEMLITLMIISIITLITIPIVHSLIQKQAEKEFFEQFQSDILYLQTLQRGNSERFRMLFENEHYVIIDAMDQTIVKRALPENWTIHSHVMHSLSFSSIGSIAKPGNITLSTNKNKYLLIFPLGKGMFRIEEQ